ncbi:MAG: nucleotidyl transferase AbiEii/AbiGii toxin family protein [Candidatus Bathyarchaeota archaeon]|jgi:predicted nucleotidyltransferase component of viral defense system
MIDEIELRELSVETSVPVGIIEKDLAITRALFAISKRKLRAHLIFKGGTAIKKVYHPRARFSEDLDFTVVNLLEEEVTTKLESLNNVNINSIKFEKIREDGNTFRGRRYRLPYTGPMNHMDSIRLDLSFTDDIIHTPQERQVRSEFSENLPSSIKVLDFKELMAEKLRAAMTRENPRDYYDLWAYLPKTDIDSLRDLVKRKCTLTKYDYNPPKDL